MAQTTTSYSTNRLIATPCDVLVARAISGDSESFDELYRSYRPLVERVITAETSDREDVPDLVQDTFFRAWRQLSGLRQPDRFRSWLLQIARRIVIDHHRGRRRRPALVGQGGPIIDTAVSESPEPSEVVDALDLRRRIESAVETLSDREVSAITLSADHELTGFELAEALQLRPDHAKVVLHRARRHLRSLVA